MAVFFLKSHTMLDVATQCGGRFASCCKEAEMLRKDLRSAELSILRGYNR